MEATVPRSISEIIADLSKPRPEYVKTKTLKGNTIKFFEWHSVVRILDEHAPGWHSEVKQVISEAGRIAVIVRICIPCAEGLVWREAIGNEDDDASGYGDPFSNAEAMAFKRTAAHFGVGLYLYNKDAPRSQAPERPQAAPPPPRTTASPAARPEPSGSLCSPMQQRTIAKLLEATGRKAATVAKHYGVAQIGELTEGQAEKAIARLKEIVAEQNTAPAVGDVLEGVEDRPNMVGARQ